MGRRTVSNRVVGDTGALVATVLVLEVAKSVFLGVIVVVVTGQTPLDLHGWSLREVVIQARGGGRDVMLGFAIKGGCSTTDSSLALQPRTRRGDECASTIRRRRAEESGGERRRGKERHRGVKE